MAMDATMAGHSDSKETPGSAMPVFRPLLVPSSYELVRPWGWSTLKFSPTHRDQIDHGMELLPGMVLASGDEGQWALGGE